MDSNLLSGHNWDMRRQIMPLAVPSRPTKKIEPKPGVPATGGGLISRQYFSPTSAIPKARPVGEPSPKTELGKKEWKPIDFSRGQVLHGVANTRNTRYQIDKQLRGIFNKSSTRSKVIDAFAGKISGSGTLTLRGAKEATYKLRQQGFTQGEINRVRRSMGF